MSIEFKAAIQYSKNYTRIVKHFVTELRQQDNIWFAEINATVYCGLMSERTDCLCIEFPTINFDAIARA